MWDPKLRTPGMEPISWLAAVTMRRSSMMEVPGFVTQCMRKSFSLNDGNSSSPIRGRTRMPARVTAPSTMMAGRGERMIRARIHS